jgi:2',3'-cyclic-nucleotide 2'-phosphodiesterase/3'-nucleotidase
VSPLRRLASTFSFARALALLFATAALALAGDSPGKVTITLLSTTDIHGHIEPWDDYANRPADRGLAKISTLVRQARASAAHSLLLDCGDTIQGTPMAYYFAVKDTSLPNPTIAAMNAMGYDAMSVGNHEFNFGLAPLWKAKRESHFPWLAANLHEAYPVRSPGYIAPYIFKTVAGVRVAIVGFVTPGVPRWEIPTHYRGYRFEQIVDAARRVIPLVRRRADLVVVIMHSGLDRDPRTGLASESDIPGENAAWELAEQVPGIDVIFFGHTHRELPEKFINGVLLAQAKNWGGSLARADIDLEHSPQGRWRILSRHSDVIPVTQSTLADPAILKLAEPYDRATQDYLDTPIATSDVALDGSTARYVDHPLVDLIHKVQLEDGRADVSMATLFFPGVRIPAGPVTVRQLAALYIYDNTLYTVEMTGAQLKDALEHAATFFTAWPAPAGARLRLPGYNADSAEGVSYTMDLAQPVGSRIRDLAFRGAPLDPAQKLRVAINNYRYTGGGGYSVYKGLPVLFRSSQEIRDLLIEYLTRTKKIPSRSADNWKIVPPDALAAILAAAREDSADATR